MPFKGLSGGAVRQKLWYSLYVLNPPRRSRASDINQTNNHGELIRQIGAIKDGLVVCKPAPKNRLLKLRTWQSVFVHPTQELEPPEKTRSLQKAITMILHKFDRPCRPSRRYKVLYSWLIA